MRKIIDCSLPPTFMSVFDRHVSADAHQWQYSKTSSSFYVAIDYVDFQCHCHFHHPSFHSVLSQWLFLDLGIMGMSSVNNPRIEVCERRTGPLAEHGTGEQIEHSMM